MTILTSKVIQQQIQGMHSDLEERLTRLRAKRDEAQRNAEKYNQASGFEKEVQRFEKEIEDLKNVYKRTFERKDEELKAAQGVEFKQEADSLIRQQSKENSDKSMALASWIKAGGKSAEFDAAWPELRKAQLQQAVLQDTEKVKPSPIRL